MEIASFVTEFSTNTYFVFDKDVTVVIDPGGSTLDLLEILNKEGKKPDFVLITHGHYDHTFSCAAFAALGAKIYMSDLDDYLVHNGGHVKFFNKYIEKFDYTNITDGEILNLNGLEFKVLSTPGHTPGGVCYLFDEYMFCGDTLFKGTIGRTDLPGASKEDMKASLKRLFDLQIDYRILSGHGQASTLNYEKETNPYLNDRFKL